MALFRSQISGKYICSGSPNPGSQPGPAEGETAPPRPTPPRCDQPNSESPAKARALEAPATAQSPIQIAIRSMAVQATPSRARTAPWHEPELIALENEWEEDGEELNNLKHEADKLWVTGGPGLREAREKVLLLEAKMARTTARLEALRSLNEPEEEWASGPTAATTSGK